ncbi:Predicted histone tail methylase containing SET domain [Ceraceosorus bombacis]|uniref:Histone-lysine N-methyltransferase SET5 n=1 Tax=Ceraceosorus bombacis TaxID=401625 RepID=A0A0P1BBC9_9BASI|nr:Predicted histone tail methylase containing SET domain [Ceraceosorus bombacis]
MPRPMIRPRMALGTLSWHTSGTIRRVAGDKKKKKKKRKTTAQKSAAKKFAAVPVSHVDQALPLPDGVRVEYFDSIKGKGLVATRDFKESEVIFVENAFIAAPPAIAVDQVFDGSLCSDCFQPLQGGMLVTRCGKTACKTRFCNRVCEQRGQSNHHRVLCVGQNPSIRPFLEYLAQHKWLSLHNVARQLARVLMTHSSSPPPSLLHNGGPASSKPPARGVPLPPATMEETLDHLKAFATVSELQRRARNPAWSVEQKGFESAMREGLRLLKLGLDPWDDAEAGAPKADGTKGPIKSFPKEQARDLFSWESFVKHLGRANLNMESQGGLYLVQSMLNHSCDPNVRTSHPPSNKGVKQATKIGALALRDIKAGEELFISYVPPQYSLNRRRLVLWRDWMFGPCTCERCTSELFALPPEERETHEQGEAWKQGDSNDQAAMRKEAEERKAHSEMLERLEEERNAKLKKEGRTAEDLAGLEDELRGSLGL